MMKFSRDSLPDKTGTIQEICFILSLLFALVGKVNHHFTSFADGVFVRLESINLDYRNSATILAANTNIFESNRLLAGLGLGVGLHYGGCNGNDCRFRLGSAIGLLPGLETLPVLRSDKVMRGFSPICRPVHTSDEIFRKTRCYASLDGKGVDLGGCWSPGSSPGMIAHEG